MFSTQEFLKNGCIFALDPDSILVGWGEWQTFATEADSAILDHGSESCAIFAPDFYNSDRSELKPWWRPQNFEVMTRAKFASSVLPKLPPEVKGFRWVEPSREGFEKQVSKIRELLQKGDLEKAVPVVHSQALEIMTQDRLAKIVVAAATAPPSLIGYGFWRSEGKENTVEGLLGATPERLFSVKNEGSPPTLVTMALAGTRAKTDGKDAAKLLMDDPKERREHQIVIEDISRELKKWGRVSVGVTGAAELPTLFHLKTQISVELVDAVALDFAAIVRALHPTPALGISPRSYGFENMKIWDDVSKRGRFGAPFGLRLKTSQLDIQDCLVAIRNVQWSDSQPPTLGSGCGFVEESVEDREWAELQLKRDSVKKVLKL